MATVLLAVAMSIKTARNAIPSSAPLFPRIRLWITFRIQVIPPFFRTSDTIQATRIEITVISYMEVTPFPMTLKISSGARTPVATPTIADSTVPPISTRKTLSPARAPTKTTRYGST